MKTQQTEQQAEAIGYAEASGQFKTQGAFSSGQTHSPLPWHTSPDNLAILSGDRNDPEIVAQLAMDDVMAIQRLDEVEANAAFIVRACSNFDNMEKGIAILQATIDTHQGTIDSLCDQLLESRNNAQRLADALKRSEVGLREAVAIINHNHPTWNALFDLLGEIMSVNDAQWEGSKQ